MRYAGSAASIRLHPEDMGYAGFPTPAAPHPSHCSLSDPNPGVGTRRLSAGARRDDFSGFGRVAGSDSDWDFKRPRRMGGLESFMVVFTQSRTDSIILGISPEI